MNWNVRKSSLLSLCLIGFFALLLLVIDIFCVPLVWALFHIAPVLDHGFGPEALIAAIYLCSIPAWVALCCLFRLLQRIRKGTVFCAENIRSMRVTAWCCMAVALLCAAAAFFHPMLLVVAAAAGLMGLIVRIVKNVFQQALEMKDELDFTV